MATSLSDVLEGDLCIGCGACAALAPKSIAMGVSRAGVLRPRITGELETSRRIEIETVCPGAHQSVFADQVRMDRDWGPLRQLLRGYATDPALREQGASGGALSGLLVSLLESGRVDGVIHVSADPARPVRNLTRISRTAAEILSAAGSRYAPSSPLDRIPDVLDTEETFAFVGRPCDISAMLAWRRVDPGAAARIPILISFLCAGTPSLKGGEAVVKSMGHEPDEVSSFTYRGPGWPGQAISRTRNGEQNSMSYAESWGAILSRHVQHRCKICADGCGMSADLVFGDVWEADADGYPSFEDRPGQSAILVRTRQGEELLSAAVAAGVLAAEPLPVETLTAMQPGQMRRRRVLLARLAGLWLLRRPIPRYSGYGLARASLRSNPIELLRNCLGTMRRALASTQKRRRSC